jgi:hypothetical protein
MRSNSGLPPAHNWATISYVPLLICASTGASDQLFFVWGRSKGKSTGPHHLLTRKRYHKLVCAVKRSNFYLPPAHNWVTISYLAPSTSASTGASDQLFFVWGRSKGKSTGSDRYVSYGRLDNLVCVVMRSNLEFGPANSTQLGHHIVCTALNMRLNRC